MKILVKPIHIRLSLALVFLLSVLLVQANTVKGRITNISSEGLPGATIVLKGHNIGTISDPNGYYTLENVPNGQHTLLATSIGYSKSFKDFTLRDNESIIINFLLKESTEELGEVVISAKSESALKKSEPIQVESMSLKTVTNQVKDLADALIMLPGVRVQSSGSLGAYADISLNGLSGQAIRTYIDGLPFEFLYPALTVNNIPLVNVNRLDVYKGVVPVDVGTDAMAGAINVISDYHSQNYLDASYSIGSFNTHQAALNTGFKINKNAILQVNGAYNYSDNNYKIDAELVLDNGKTEQVRVERFHDGYELLHTDLALVVLKNKVFDFMKFGFSYSDYYKELNNNLTISRTPWGEYTYDGSTKVSSLNFEKEFLSSLTFKNDFAFSYSSLNTIDTTTNQYAWDGSVVQSDDQPGEYNDDPILSTRNNSNIINRATLEYKITENDILLISNVYAFQDIYGRDKMKSREDDILTYPQDLEKNVTGLLYTKTSKGFTINLAGKFYIYSLVGVDSRGFATDQHDTDHGYYAALKYDITQNLFVRTSYEKGIRIPNSGEFFGNGNYIAPNSTLRPEKSNNINLELSFSSKEQANLPWRIEINGFYRDQEDLIRLSSQEILPKYVNQKGVRTVGLEAEAFVKPIPQLKLSSNFTQLKQTITRLNSGNGNRDQIGTPNPNTPNFFIFNELEYIKQGLFSADNQFRSYIQYYYVETFNHIPVGSFYNPDNWVPAQHRINLGVSYTLLNNKLTAAVNIFNVLDNKLYDNFNVPRPGRSYNLRVAYRLNNF